MTGHTHLSSISVEGAVASSAQGKLIGSFESMPEPSAVNEGQIALYVGPTTEKYTKGKYYVSPGTSGTDWGLADFNTATVIVDENLSIDSSNAIANKAVAIKINNITDSIGTDETLGTVKYRVKQLETSVGTDDTSGLRQRVNAIEADYASKASVTEAINTAVSSTYRYRGVKTSYSELPSEGNVVGDVYNVLEAYEPYNIPAGTNWAWDGSAWDALGGEVDLSVLQPKLTAVDGVTIDSSNNIGLTATGVTTESVGGVTKVPVLTFDAQGRAKSATTEDIYPPTTVGTANQYWRATGTGAGVWTSPDSAPTNGSDVLISSGVVYTAIGEVNQAISGVDTKVDTKQDKITISTSEPTSSDGSDGDLWATIEG